MGIDLLPEGQELVSITTSRLLPAAVVVRTGPRPPT